MRSDYFLTMDVALFVITAILGVREVTSQEIYGASVHWRPADNQGNSIALSYRLVWEMGSSVCSPLRNNQFLFRNCVQKKFDYQDGSRTVHDVHPGMTFQWMCVGGCQAVTMVTNMSELYYTDIDVFNEVLYETGIEMRTFTFGSKDDKANIKLQFHYPNGTSVDGLGEAHLSMAIRNDTNRPNISPLLNVFPVYRVPLGCQIDINLFPFDGDGDYVRCHWETYPGVDQHESGAVLYEDMCRMNFVADVMRYKAGDQLRVSLYAQDYSDTPVRFRGVATGVSSGPFSRTPLKFLVHIGNATTCTAGPKFTVEGTLKPSFKRSYTLPFQKAKLPFEVPDKNQRMLTTGPRFMIFEERSNVTKIDEGRWDNITDVAMKGIHQACGLAYTQDGVPGDSRCAVLMVEEPDECLSDPCLPGGVCNNLFEYYTCKYPRDQIYNGHTWSASCQNVTIHETNKDDTPLWVGVPVGLSLLLLLIAVAVTFYMKRYCTDKLKQSVVEPDEKA